MGKVNLILKYRLSGENHIRVAGATRIALDVMGTLTVTDAQTGEAETIPLGTIEALSIHLLRGIARPALAA
jgi:hypothetical protein